MARACKHFSKAALARGTRIEQREHGLPLRMARKIARDHLCEKGNRAYPVKALGGLRVNLASKPAYRVEKTADAIYFRSRHRWSRVSKAAVGRRWYIAKGWKGDVKAEKLEHTNKRAHALIIGEGWVEDDK